MRIENMCRDAGVTLRWRPFLLAPIFRRQGWTTSPFAVNPLRGAYMWRDMERLTDKYGLPFKRPSVFPRNTTLAARVAAAFSDEPWIGEYIRRAFVANFGEDCELNDEETVRRLLRGVGQNATAVLQAALDADRREALRRNTQRALAIDIFGAPNCLVDGELFWGEETLYDALAFAIGKGKRYESTFETVRAAG